MADDSTALTGFFSYAHSDNIFNCLQNLRDNICREYQILTGQELELFIDVHDLAWGSHWREAIASGIATSSFFLPVLSPSYFMSEACIQELQQYMDKARQTQAPELILPLLFSDFSDIKSSQDDALVEQMRNVQWIDITHVQEYKRHIGPYGALVLQIAKKLQSNNDALAKKTAEEVRQAENRANVGGTVEDDAAHKPRTSSVDSSDFVSLESLLDGDDTEFSESSGAPRLTAKNAPVSNGYGGTSGEPRTRRPLITVEQDFLVQAEQLATNVESAVTTIRDNMAVNFDRLRSLAKSVVSTQQFNNGVMLMGSQAKQDLEPLINDYGAAANQLSRLVSAVSWDMSGSEMLSVGVKVVDDGQSDAFRSALLSARTAIKKLSFTMRNKNMKYFSRMLQGEIAEIRYCNATALGAIEFALSWSIESGPVAQAEGAQPTDSSTPSSVADAEANGVSGEDNDRKASPEADEPND